MFNMYARMNSIIRTLIRFKQRVIIGPEPFNPNEYEIKIIKKIFEWPK